MCIFISSVHVQLKLFFCGSSYFYSRWLVYGLCAFLFDLLIRFYGLCVFVFGLLFYPYKEMYYVCVCVGAPACLGGLTGYVPESWLS